MAEKDLSETPQRWTAKRRSALVLSILKGETTAREAARKHGLTVFSPGGCSPSLRDPPEGHLPKSPGTPKPPIPESCNHPLNS